MPPVAKKQIEQLREGLVKNLTLDFFEEEEIASLLEEIDSLDARLRQKTLALCAALSHASSSVVPGALQRMRKASLILSFRDLDRWITQAFDLLDSKGIDAFMSFVSKTDEESLREFEHPGGLHLQEIAPILETYLRGISGLDIKISPEREPHTDTAVIFLPQTVNRFREAGKNFLFYKLMAVHQWALIAGGSLIPGEESLKGLLGKAVPEHPDIDAYFGSFPERRLATDLFLILEAVRLGPFLERELPGLARAAEEIRAELFKGLPSLDGLSGKTAFVEGLYQCFLKGRVKKPVPEGLRPVLKKVVPFRRVLSSRETMEELIGIYELAKDLGGEYVPRDLGFLGAIRPEKVSHHLRALRRARRKRFEGIVSKLLQLPESEPREKRYGRHPSVERSADPQKEYLLLRGRLIELDSELREMIEEKGGIPGGILVKGSDFGAGSPITLSELFQEEEEETRGEGKAIKYDEWDYRRGGYKKNWCSLYEHDILPGNEPFVDLTLKRYGGYVTVLRNKFELLRRETRILKRQWEGEDIDIDATVEAFSDLRAGLAPGENLFVRLDRQERNIAVLFLLDMSGSTKGWVNQAEKEALVLMCEALDALEDRCAIYGFSGMTRTKCDYYKIKGFEDAYAETVKSRISGIVPKDYTRMGPPLRHSVRILRSVEARTKLLITLSDGKPEDWDAYKGDYGIEDTRKALIEAREQGIHSFCITIDREASAYLPHMFGEANYIVIDDVHKLPNRITEIYRRLTT